MVWEVSYTLLSPEHQEQKADQLRELQAALAAERDVLTPIQEKIAHIKQHEDVNNETVLQRLAALENEQRSSLMKMLKLQRDFIEEWDHAKPDDVVVDRPLRTVYLIAKDGSRRRCDDPVARQQAIDKVRRLLAEQTPKSAPPTPEQA